MRKRVALARAIALAPRAILYDEPTTGLDPITANTINHLIRSLQTRLGVTSIVVTHDIQSAFTVGDRIAFLSEGEILFDGTVEQARRAQEPVLRRFLHGGGYA
jgi:phospholipid/cholesterol/gamma-HCH transport system ATP-binding protein